MLERREQCQVYQEKEKKETLRYVFVLARASKGESTKQNANPVMLVRGFSEAPIDMQGHTNRVVQHRLSGASNTL